MTAGFKPLRAQVGGSPATLFPDALEQGAAFAEGWRSGAPTERVVGTSL